MIFNERMKERRAEMDLTLSDLSRLSGVARSYLYQLERGESQPSIDKAQAVASALGTTVAWLIGETEHTQSARQARVLQIVESALRELHALDNEEGQEGGTE